MGLPKKPDPTDFAESINAIQRAAPHKLSIFTEDDGDGVQQFREVHDVAVLNLLHKPERDEWRRIHNDKNIEIISENERSSRISTLTYIKYVRRVLVGEPEPKSVLETETEEFQEPCEEDDPLMDKMWGG
jgi:hypothetical protein